MEAQSTEGPAFRAMSCKSCGAAMRIAADAEAPACSACGSDELRPLAVPGGAISYALADRSSGTTGHDIAFAQWAKWTAAITPHQYDSAVHRQNSEQSETGRARPIHEHLIEMHALDEKLAESLLRFMALPRPDALDAEFAALVVERQEADEEAVANTVAALRAQAAGGENPLPLCQALVHRRILPEVTMLKLLQEQAHEGGGTLRMALAMEGPRVQAGLLSHGRRRDRVVSTAKALGLLSIIALTVWLIFHERTIYVYGVCGNCNTIARMEPPDTWPASCISCGRMKVLPAWKCPDCDRYYGRTTPIHIVELCPHEGCDSTSGTTVDDTNLPPGWKQPKY
jgi:hypothetical protein